MESPTEKQVLVLCTCDGSHPSEEGFVLPPVGAFALDPDEPGRLGFLWGRGNGSLVDWRADRWVVVQVAEKDLDLGEGYVRFSRGEVVYRGDRRGAAECLQNARPDAAVFGGDRRGEAYDVVCVADHGRAHTAHHGVACSGNFGRSVAGSEGAALSGTNGTAQAGDRGIALANTGGQARVGAAGVAAALWGQAESGDDGVAIANGETDSSVASAGHRGIAVCEYGVADVLADGVALSRNGHSGTGPDGLAIVAEEGTARAGAGGVLVVGWWDERSGRRRLAVAYVGEQGIQPDVTYRVNDQGRFVAAE